MKCRFIVKWLLLRNNHFCALRIVCPRTIPCSNALSVYYRYGCVTAGTLLDRFSRPLVGARLSAPRTMSPVLQVLEASPDGAPSLPFTRPYVRLLGSADGAVSFRPLGAGTYAHLGPSFGLVPCRAPSALWAISLADFPGCGGSAAGSAARGSRAVPPVSSHYTGRFSCSGSRRFRNGRGQ